MSRIYIAGAHSRGTTMGYYMTYLNPMIEIAAYLYDNEEENPNNVNGIPVIKIDENSHLDIECPVYLATRGINHDHLINTLTQCRMKYIIPVDVKLDIDIRNRFLRKYFHSIGREFLKLEELGIPDVESITADRNICIYVAESEFDKPLQELYKLADYEKRIQVGTALSKKRLDMDCFDDFEDNISNRNAQFCELTGLYWIWKHAKEDIVGFVHYRRHFLLPEDWKKRMKYHNIDVLLPLPLYVVPNLEENFKTRHVASNWDNMLNYLKKKNEEEYKNALDFFNSSSLYSPCNMFIMRKEILNDLCQWLFPILFAVADQGGTLENKYQNRYPGFISERLITYFFDKNKEKYKIVYVDKNFLQ